MAKKSKPVISRAEWPLMEAVWDEAPLTAMDITERVALRSSKGLSPQTIKTLLGRLVKKGALSFRQQGNRYLYSPSIKRTDYVDRESESFLQRVFQGAADSLLAHFVNRTDLSAEEISRLRKMLDEKEAS